MLELIVLFILNVSYTKSRCIRYIELTAGCELVYHQRDLCFIRSC